MSEWMELNRESQKSWESNAEFWDNYMGEHNKRFHNELIKPQSLALLTTKSGENIPDITCGHGNFSRALAEKAHATAIDYNCKLIEQVKK